ncbi:MAG: archaeal proteasome endopeptidase complex subunit beta [Desulfurococcaceae archaeon]|jgi:proteasome beta subunit|nr:archaeal proteasome endopeptidase complex subunit beta [Desulfurococcaceae archaeon]
MDYRLRMLASGTTTVGLVAGDYVVLAADKRATAGFMIASRRVKKIVKLTDYAVMTMAGLVADAQMLADILRSEAKLYELDTGSRMSVRGIAVLLSNILFSYKALPFIVQVLVGGYDVKPRLYLLDLFGSITEEKLAATGSGSPVAYGVLEQHYREDLSLDEAVKIATAAIRASTLRDAASGDGVDIAIVGRGFIEEKFIPFTSITV